MSEYLLTAHLRFTLSDDAAAVDRQVAGERVIDMPIFGPVCILRGGPIYTIDGMRFEMHPYCGPSVVSKRDESRPLAQQPGPRHRFWKAVELWAKQGRRVTRDGVCIYDTPREPETVCLVGRHYVEVPKGRDPQEVRREWFARLGVVPPEGR